MVKYLVLVMCISHLSSRAYQTPLIPLLGTAKLGSKKLTAQLLACGVDPNQVDELGNTPLHYAVHIGSKEVTDLLLASNANPNARNNKGKTPLHVAVHVDNDYLARRLLLYGAHPNSPDNKDNTPLHLAAGNAQKIFTYKITDELLCHGADPQIENSSNQTPLMLAKQAKATNNYNGLFRHRQYVHIDRVIGMLQHTSRRTKQLTVLDKGYIRCAKTNNVPTMRQIAQCPTINKDQQVGKYKRTALMYAARNNRTAMVDCLVNELQVDKQMKDNNGKTAYDYAKAHNNEKLSRLVGL